MVPAYPKQHIYVPNSFLIHDCYASKIMNFDPYTFICVLSPWHLGGFKQLTAFYNSFPVLFVLSCLQCKERIKSDVVVPLRMKILKYSILGPHLSLIIHACMHAKLLQLCPTMCRPMDCSLQGSSVHGILQARILEWVALPSSGDLPDPGIKPESLMSPTLADRFFTTRATWEAPLKSYFYDKWYSDLF